ncbi:Peptidase deuterolysin [Cordyceps militaris]|uniref:Neutral protease 2 n=1 Tax=Cordyceps militaris TaxID=73501 RepID=A0A2H4S874_CORMI|nr:Peptidase deuterolysin [Cordyceps militaris]
MKYSITAITLAGLAAAAAINGKEGSPVTVSLSSVDHTTIKATITNNGDKAYNIMHKGTLLDSLPVDKFRVTRDGAADDAAPAAFHGVKLRMANTGFEEADFTPLAPGESKAVVVDVASLYALDTSGTYHVHAAGRLRFAEANSTELVRGRGLRFASNRLALDVDGPAARQVLRDVEARLAAMRRSTVQSDCTDAQKATVVDGLARCASQASKAADAALNGSAAKFKEYFMSTAAKDRQLVADRLTAVAKECDASPGGVLDLHCKDVYNYCASNTYAYTRSSANAVIWCKQYWNHDLETETCHGDDKTGTTIHEFTHADSVFSPGTDDNAYGYDDCMQLSRADALTNADTYEYYANAIHLGC